MAIIEPRLEEPEVAAPWWRRLGWLAVYWAAGVLMLGIVATILRQILL